MKKKEVPQIYVTKPAMPPLKEFEPLLKQIWASQILTNGGSFHQELEKKLCEYLDVPYISLFNNGTVALVTAIQALNLSGEVITTPFSYVATSHSLLWNKITPVFVDIEPDTLSIDPKRIRAAITSKTTAIMPVHVYGYPGNLIEIQKIAEDANLKVVYDAAHAFGVHYDDQSILNFGDLSVLSFHATKIFNTFEGGAIVCKDLETKIHIDRLKNFGFVDEITVVTPGINGKMSEINAAFGLLQLQYVDVYIEKRRIISDYYKASLCDVAGLKCLNQFEGKYANFSYFPVLVDRPYPLTRDELYEKMKLNGINTRRYFYPLISDFPMYKNNQMIRFPLPNSEKISKNILCLPIYPDLELSVVNDIVMKIKSFEGG
jgi:dTDP-4-amino-4,6-dideoxygalactose transaminase